MIICTLIYIYIHIYIYIYIQIYQSMPQSDYLILGAGIARATKRFQHPLLTNKSATMTQECSNYHLSPSKGLSNPLNLTQLKLILNVIFRGTSAQTTYSSITSGQLTVITHFRDLNDKNVISVVIFKLSIIYIQLVIFSLHISVQQHIFDGLHNFTKLNLYYL